MDMNMIIDMLFFVVVALFLLGVVALWSTRAEPKLIVTSMLIPASMNNLRKRMKGNIQQPAGMLSWVILLVVVFVILFLLWAIFTGSIGKFISGFVYWIEDTFGFV